MTSILSALLNTVIVIVCLFMICLILIQRGKGGGLAGAFGGVGGSSAFGTKSGDVFTKVTMITATVWIVLSMLLVILYNRKGESAFDDGTSTSVSREVAPKSARDKAKDKGKAAPDTGTVKEGALPDVPPGSAESTGIPALPDVPVVPAPK